MFPVVPISVKVGRDTGVSVITNRAGCCVTTTPFVVAARSGLAETAALVIIALLVAATPLNPPGRDCGENVPLLPMATNTPKPIRTTAAIRPAHNHILDRFAPTPTVLRCSASRSLCGSDPPAAFINTDSPCRARPKSPTNVCAVS